MVRINTETKADCQSPVVCSPTNRAEEEEENEKNEHGAEDVEMHGQSPQKEVDITVSTSKRMKT